MQIVDKIKYSLSKNANVRNMYIKMRQIYYYKEWRKNPMGLADKMFYKKFRRYIDWDNPTDLNEKINWLKFHYDQRVWGRLADKYAVREYVEKCGLKDILVPLYGKYNSAQDVISDWNRLPEEFVIKSNNGCSHIFIVSNDSEIGIKKELVNKNKLIKILSNWLKENKEGVSCVEMHYQYVENCIVVEKLLKDESIKDYSHAPIDYKIYCAGGKPYMCYISYGRNPITHQRIVDIYDTKWNRRSDIICNGTVGKPLERPKNWELMLEYAYILGKDHPQLRIDFYNISGKIYFGEMTFTSAGGFDTEFTSEFYEDIGKLVDIDLKMPGNEFYKKR